MFLFGPKESKQQHVLCHQTLKMNKNDLQAKKMSAQSCVQQFYPSSPNSNDNPSLRHLAKPVENSGKDCWSSWKKTWQNFEVWRATAFVGFVCWVCCQHGRTSESPQVHGNDYVMRQLTVPALSKKSKVVSSSKAKRSRSSNTSVFLRQSAKMEKVPKPSEI